MDKSNETCRMSRATLRDTTKGNSKEDRDSLALREASSPVPLLTRRISMQVLPLPRPQPQGRGLISLKGLLTAQRFSKGLKERTAQKLAEKKGIIRGPARKLIPIIHDQVPAGCAQPQERFPATHISQLVLNFLSSRLHGMICVSGALALALSEELRGLICAVCPPRYRLVCLVSLGPAGQKGAVLASRCLWDTHTDTCVSHNIHTHHVFCVASVFAVFYE